MNGVFKAGMLMKPAGHEAKARKTEAQNYFWGWAAEANATMYKAQVRLIIEQLIMYERQH